MKKAHLIGIGGIGLSALARLLQSRGVEVSGCERNPSLVTEALARDGIVVSNGHSPEHITKDIDVLIYSDAVPEDHPERIRARELGVLQKSYAQALGEIANQSKCLVAVAGTHGKTTTTAMLTDIFEAAQLNPTAVIGSLRNKTHSNFRAGSEDYFLVEADEYMRHFLNLSPHILVITNIDADHLDYYKDLHDIQSAFRELAAKVPSDGAVVYDGEDANVRPVVEGLSCKTIDYRAYVDESLPLKVLAFNRINAAAALAVADVLHIDSVAAKKALAEFSGTWRRFEYRGKTESGAMVYDDYAHHPAEIETTIKSVREQFSDTKIIVAFHPHLYSRTKLFMDDFARALSLADEALIAPIFAAREAADPTVSSTLLAQHINAAGGRATALELPDIEAYLRTHTDAHSLIITMGAGDIYKITDSLVQHMQ